MEGIVLTESPIDSEIAAVRSEIEALRHRRSLLSHALLSSRKFKQRLEQAKSSPRNSRDSVQSVSEFANDHENTSIANLHRTCTGITAFRVQDPDPNAVDSGKVLGVRLDIFSAEKRTFQTPYYILLNQPKPESEQLKIHKHTIPPYIPLQPLISKYLPYNAEDDEPTKQRHEQNLPRLVRVLRKELVAHHKRVEAFASLKRELGKRHGVEEVKMLDASGREIEMHFTDKIVARIRVATEGKIENVAVGPSKSIDMEEAAARGIKAYRQIKRVVEDGDGRIDGLIARLKRRPKN